ncbi:hypothetical protein IB267_32895 [Ensifer sp. ENS09]|nr:hypothetical protein [Ensifer sp. ENS09]
MAKKIPSDSVPRRAEELDALDAILPFDRRDQLAALLTDDDVATLNRGIPLPEAMQQSLHKSITQAASCYNNAERKNGRAARLIV